MTPGGAVGAPAGSASLADVKKVVVVTGPGRSGTSALAGSLGALGMRVPRPHLPADERTEEPSFETRWVADHHQVMLRRDPVVRVLDSRPEAAGFARELPNADDAAELDRWLTGKLTDAPTGQVLVNDPRTFWFHDHWTAGATRLGAGTAFVTLLQHPVEFVRSRDAQKAAADRDPRLRRQRDSAYLAGWANALLVVEETTRADERAVLREADLRADWRLVLAQVGEQLGLVLDPDAGAEAVGTVLGRSRAVESSDWASVDVPDALRAVAEGLWDQLGRLVADPHDASVPDALAALRADYDHLFDHAVGVATDHTATREVHVGRRTRAAVSREYESQVAELEQQLEESHLGSGDEGLDDRPPAGRWRR